MASVVRFREWKSSDGVTSLTVTEILALFGVTR